MSAPGRLAAACLAVPALGLAACGAQSVSISGLKGEQHAVAQTIANLQSDVTAGDQKKICSEDLAGSIVRRLNESPQGCQQAIKTQLDQVDNIEIAVHSVSIDDSGASPTASASVRSIFDGKTRTSTVALIKEDGKWRIAGLH